MKAMRRLAIFLRYPAIYQSFQCITHFELGELSLSRMSYFMVTLIIRVHIQYRYTVYENSNPLSLLLVLLMCDINRL